MARLHTVDDSKWDEVLIINGYAVFMGYLMMGVRGLGVLVITWTTVVLLGGFVSVLGKKDFWCLTFITLVQTAGVFNILLRETLSDFVRSWWGLLGAAASTVTKLSRKGKTTRDVWIPRVARALFLSVIQALVLVMVLFPVAVLYMFGVYISAGVGLWRLIEHDFDNAEGGANLMPALEVLYSLALAQGLLFGYKTMHGLGAKFGLAEFVAARISSLPFDSCKVDRREVSAYLEDTVAGCEKDPSFAAGRNLVTYGIDLMMGAKSNDGFIAGLRLLGTVIDHGRHKGRKVLAKHLLTSSDSYIRVIQRLLHTLGHRSPYSREIREHAARIVALVADVIYLEQFPRGVESISSLLDTSEAHGASERNPCLPSEYERHWLLEDHERLYLTFECERTDSIATQSLESVSNRFNEGLVIEGLNIIWKLAVDSGNRRIIINTEGLVPKINMVPLLLDKIHTDDHILWEAKVHQHCELMSWLLVSPEEAMTRSQGEMLSHSEATFSNLINIVECISCATSQKIQATGILLDPSADTSFIMASENRRRMFTWILLLVFLSPDEDSCGFLNPMKQRNSDIRRLAGEKLSGMLTSQTGEASACGILQVVHFVLGDLTRALLDAGDISNRLHAAKLLNHLCYRCTKNDEYLKELKTAMIRVMPEVLNELLCYTWAREETLAVTKANNNVQSSLQDIDLEVGGVSEGRGHEHNSSSRQRTYEQPDELRQALRFLCGRIWVVWYRYDSGVARQLDEIAARICSEQGKSINEFLAMELFIYS